MSAGNPSQARWHAKSIESSNAAVLLSRAHTNLTQEDEDLMEFDVSYPVQLVTISNSERPEDRYSNKLKRVRDPYRPKGTDMGIMGVRKAEFLVHGIVY